MVQKFFAAMVFSVVSGLGAVVLAGSTAHAENEWIGPFPDYEHCNASRDQMTGRGGISPCDRYARGIGFEVWSS